MADIDPAVIEQLTKSASAMETFISEFKQTKQNETADQLPDLEKSLKDAIEAARIQAVEEAKAYVAEQTAATRPAVDDAPKPEYKSLAEWLIKTKRGEIERKDFGEGSGAVGGFMVPDQFIPEILRIPMEQGIVRSHGATVIPMETDTAKMPALNPTSHATNFFGGMLGYWLGEAAAITASTWTAKEVELNISTLAAVGKVSQQLLSDSPLAMGAVIERQFGEVVQFMEDQAFVDGNGTGQPQGVIGSGCEVAVARSGAGDVTFTDVVTMESKFLGSDDRGVYLANRDIIPKLYAIKDGGNNQLFIPNVAPGAPGTLFGKPIIFTEKCSALGTKGDLILADWAYYLIGDRQQVVVDWADQLYFLNIQSAVRLYERVDGKPWMDATYTPRKGAAKSPFVVLN